MELSLSPAGLCPIEQQKIYQGWFKLVDSDRDGRITGDDAAKFFAVSKLSCQEIKQLWAIAHMKRQGFLGFAEFVIAMQLISLAQDGELSVDILKIAVDWENVKPPVMDGLDDFAVIPTLCLRTLVSFTDRFLNSISNREARV